MTREETIAGLKEVLAVIRPKTNFDEVTEDTRLIQDLNIDSLSMMFMSLAIEEKFSFRFETQAPFETVGQVCEYIENKVNQK